MILHHTTPTRETAVYAHDTGNVGLAVYAGVLSITGSFTPAEARKIAAAMVEAANILDAAERASRGLREVAA